MRDIKQIRENYDLVTEKAESDANKLTALVRAGLFDSKKLPIIKRALEKDPNKMTPAERKVVMQLLDALMSEVLHSQQVFSKVKQNVRDKENLDEQDRLSKFDPRFKEGYPSDKDMPMIIILKRKAIRVYPDNQKVALYYSQALDKYVTIPFGPNRGSLNEANEYVVTKQEKKKISKFGSKEDEQAYKDISKRNREDRKKLKSGNFDSDKSRETTQDNIKQQEKRLAAIEANKKTKEVTQTKKVDTSRIQPKKLSQSDYKHLQKTISRDPSMNFAHRLAAKAGAAYGRKFGATGSTRQKLLGSPTVTGALVKKAKSLFKEEDLKNRFRQRLDEKRELQNEALPFLGAGALGGASVISRIPGIVTGAGGKLKDLAKGAYDKVKNIGKKTPETPTPGGKPATPKAKRDRLGRAADVADIASSLGGLAGGKGSGGGDTEVGSGPREYNFSMQAKTNAPQFQRGSDTIRRERERQISQKAMMRESNVFETVKTLASQNVNESIIEIDGKNIKINSFMAGKINNLYESLNEDNKAKMVTMMNEDVDSFKKILDFAVRQ